MSGLSRGMCRWPSWVCVCVSATNLSRALEAQRGALVHSTGPGMVGCPLPSLVLIIPMPHMWTAPSSQGVLQCFDQIACVHMSGLLVRSHMNAGQDGFRDGGPKHKRDLVEGHCGIRSVPRRGSIDHTICLLSCKFWHRLSTVAVQVLPVSG
jgi:hypothetical protein